MQAHTATNHGLGSPGVAPGATVRAARRRRRGRSALLAFAATMAAALPLSAHAQFEISRQPLSIGGQGVPGNLALVPSVEYPTVNSVANIDSNYSSGTAYTGYFDPGKCYRYSYSTDETQRHFFPSSTTSTRTCSGSGEWSGNFLNWAATQTIDPFRKVLTGGYRVVDTSTETWLEKARHDGQGGPNSLGATGYYPNRSLTNTSVIEGATPFSASSLHMRIAGLGNRMRFQLDGNGNLYDDSNTQHYNPTAGVGTSDAYDAWVRVEVCDPAVGLEQNCVQYDQGWKPEGVIQENAGDLRYSVFGYLNDHDLQRDGGVLRARNSFVGPEIYDQQQGEFVTNPNAEWDPNTGVFVQNPRSGEATETTNDFGITIDNSGVINYINKFGQLNNNDYKNFDPVSELYYTALRYFRNLGNVPEYTKMAGASDSTKAKWLDDFPVLTTWDDPIGGWCEPNVALGIGDVYTHADKNLPGNSTYLTDEPNKPSEVKNDGSVDVITATNKVGELESGLTATEGETNNWSGRNNSAYIAGLAYDAHTTDMRADLQQDQTLETHWVDVLENQTLEPPATNQYYLAAKYGGFDVPDGFEPYNHTDPLAEALWHTNGETLTSKNGSSNDGVTFERPDNYYVAGRASAMVDSLEEAFARITADVSGSASAIAANSTRLDAGTLIYQARFNTSDWSGQLLALEVDPDDGSVDTNDPAWDAADRIPAPANRDIFTLNPSAAPEGVRFQWTNLNATQQTALDTNLQGNDDGRGQDRLAFLRGDRSLEIDNGGRFRNRGAVLGDIVNSDPFLAADGNFGYNILPNARGGDTYRAFLEDKRERREMLYVGVNDGMLHGFDAETGDEILAYVPNEVYSNLSDLTSPNYKHRYYVDGSPVAADVHLDLDGDGSDEWGTVLAGGTGAGGRAVFALDVTTPDSFGRDDVMWEFTHNELGFTIGQPQIVPMNDGSWSVIFGNGYNSDSGTARLFIVPLDDPANPTIIDTEVGGTGDAANGLGPVTPVDIDNDLITDFIYAGDMQGNLWKFDVSGNNWQSAFSSGGSPAPLYHAQHDDGDPDTPDAQPITAAPEIGPHPDPTVDLMVYFGTGKFFEVGDNVVPDNPQLQTFYGLEDSGEQISGRGELQQQTIEFEGTISGNDFRVTSDNTPADADKGWFMDLESPVNGLEGEQVVAKAIRREDRVIFVTNIPSPDPCDFGGDSWIMEVDGITGGRLPSAVFDVNDDGSIDESDIVELGDGTQAHAGGRKFNDLVTSPAILDTAGDTEFKYLSGSSGSVERVEESGSSGNLGRQSWRQLR